MNYFATPRQFIVGFRSASSVDWTDLLLRLAIVVFLAMLIFLAFDGRIYKPLLQAADNREWAEALLRPSVFWLLMGTVMLGFRTVLWFGYRPFAAVTVEDAPALTVIIPAYNEGAMVAQTIDRKSG